jgi:hypothetical protein
MWPLIILALTALAGGIYTMADNKEKLRADGKPLEKQENEKALQLEALKAIRESAFQRWNKRRNYEWLLSISIWGAIAAFSSLVFNKDFPGRGNWFVAGMVGVFGLIVARVQYVYLSGMFNHTIADARVQRWAEREMGKLACGLMPSEDPAEPSDPNADKAENRSKVFYPPLSKYGLAQVWITVVLVLASATAVGFVRNTPPGEDHASIVTVNGHVAATVTQQETPATPAPPSTAPANAGKHN